MKKKFNIKIICKDHKDFNKILDKIKYHDYYDTYKEVIDWSYNSKNVIFVKFNSKEFFLSIKNNIKKECNVENVKIYKII